MTVSIETTNAISAAIREYRPYDPFSDQPRVYQLLPCLTMDKVDYFITEARSHPDGFIFRGVLYNEYHFYYCHYNSHVYQIILDRHNTVLQTTRPVLTSEYSSGILSDL